MAAYHQDYKGYTLPYKEKIPERYEIADTMYRQMIDAVVGGGVAIGGAIAGGVVTRLLYEGVGNLLAESANLTWDGTNLLASGNAGAISALTQFDFNGVKMISAPATDNLFIGVGAGDGCTGDYCYAIGKNCLNTAGSTGDRNFAIGDQAMANGAVTGTGNFAIGYQALYELKGASNNVGIGTRALQNNLAGDNNIAIGLYTGQYTTGGSNVLVGSFAGQNSTSGSGNSCIGYGAGIGKVGGYLNSHYNVYIGLYSGFKREIGSSYNVGVGKYALYNLTRGIQNTAIGTDAGYTLTTLSNNVFIGHQAGYYETGGSTLFIDNIKRTNEADGRIKALIYGVFNAAVASQVLVFNAATITFNGGVDTDVTVNFIGTTNSGLYKYMEDEDRFDFSSVLRTTTSLYRRYYHLPVASFDPGASGAAWQDADGNQLAGYQLNADSDTLEFNTGVHAGDWDAASNLTVEVKFSINAAGGAPGDTVDWQLLVYIKGVGDAVTKLQTLIESTTIDAAAQFTKFVETFDIIWDDGGGANQVDPGDDVSFILTCEATGDVTDVRATGATFHYSTTHSGIESGDT